MSREITAIVPYVPPLFGREAFSASKQRAFRFMRKRLQTPRITIHDLYFLPDRFGPRHGQAGTLPIADACGGAEINYLKAHMISLMQFAALRHTKKPYHITRLSTPEYSFFTSTPLNTDQFQETLSWLTESAEKLPNNVHILLSTLAVEIHGELHNIALYITCGAEARAHIITKMQPSASDYKYDDHYTDKRGTTTPTLFQALSGAPGDDSLRHKGAQVALSVDGSQSVVTDPCFVVAVDDTELQVSVEICFDQAEKAAAKSLSTKFTHNLHHMPRYCTCMITSNVTDVRDDARITPWLSHVDTEQSLLAPEVKAENCLVQIDRPLFGAAYSIYDMGTNICPELIKEHEVKRRQSNRQHYQRKYNVTLSELDIVIEIDHLLQAEDVDGAIALLQLLDSAPDTLVRRFVNDIDRLPGLELNQLAQQAEHLNKHQQRQIIARANELEHIAMQHLYDLLAEGHLVISHDIVNHLCQQASHLPSCIDLPFFSDALYAMLDMDSINACAKHFSKLSDKIFNKIAKQYKDLNELARRHLLHGLDILSDDNLNIIVSQPKHADDWVINMLLLQADRLGGEQISHLLMQAKCLCHKSAAIISKHIDEFSSAGIN